VAVLFQFGRALLRVQGALSGKPMFWLMATLPMYDPGMLASWYRRRYGSARGKSELENSRGGCYVLNTALLKNTLTKLY
jgi:hypothetical protein